MMKQTAPRGQDSNNKWLWSVETLFYGLLAAFAAAVSLTLSGCVKAEAEKVDYGPQVSENSILSAISAPLANTDPTKIKVGEFVHVAETQEIPAAQVINTVSDTGQTIIDRQETSADITYTVVETKILYTQGSQQKSSTEFNVVVKKNALTDSASMSAATVFPSSNVRALAAINETLHPAAAARVTYHNLRVSSAQEPPPYLVRSQSGCLGIPNCSIKVTNVSFDIVSWTGDTGERAHYEYALSADVPYLAQVMNTCITLMVPVSGSNSKTLLKQCKPVVNFRFESAP
jgi:hypothetical protein